ncbi:hypothetical protein [Bradyrhizobium sp. USDA 4350]
MPCIVDRDANGTSYTIPADETVKNPGGRQLPGVPELAIWWARRFKERADETLIIKQENLPDRADVIELTLGQLYDLIDAANKAVEAA